MASAKRVAVLDPDGRFGTVDASDAEAVTRAGGRVLSAKEVAEREVQARYEAKPLAEKVVGAVKTAALATPLAPVVAPGIGDEAAPEVAAFGAGTREGLTAGLSEGVTRQAIGAFGTHKAAEDFATSTEQKRTASPAARGLGQLYGMGVGSALGAATPAGAVAGAGTVVEQGAAKLLAGVASRGAMGRAVATGGSLAARGAVEGALFGAGDAVGEAMLGDHELAADKLWAASGMGALGGAVAGGALGFAGSLAASGAKSAGKGLARVLGRGDDAAVTAAAKVDTSAVPLSARIDSSLRRTADNLAVDALGATQAQQNKVLATLGKTGRQDLGHFLNREIPALATKGDGASLQAAVMGGRADDMLGAIRSVKAREGAAIGDIVRAHPARVDVASLTQKADAIAAAMKADPTRIAGADAFSQRVKSTLEAFKNGDKIGADGAMDLAEMYYARAGLERQAFELQKGSAAHGAFEEWLREVDDLLVGKLAAGNSRLKDEILTAKRRYQLAAAAEKLAKQGAKRVVGNNIFGLREGIGMAVGLATGSPVAALATGVLGKVARERGAAAGAYALNRMADMQVLTKLVAGVDESIARASRGVLQAPAASGKGAAATLTRSAAKATGDGPYRTAPVRERAETAARRVAEIQANPERHIDQITRATDGMQQVAPSVASSYARRMTDAAAFLASKLPAQPDPDPFDPHPSPRMSQVQAIEFMRYVEYVEKPTKFFDEAARGEITFEGVETARALMPRAFAEMQMRVADGLAELLAQGKTVPLRQRERLGILMDFPAVPSQRPEHIAFLQRNVVGSEKSGQPPQGPQQQGPKRPLQMKTHESALDRLEDSGAGRR